MSIYVSSIFFIPVTDNTPRLLQAMGVDVPGIANQRAMHDSQLIPFLRTLQRLLPPSAATRTRWCEAA
jgi:hypothetical protein